MALWSTCQASVTPTEVLGCLCSAPFASQGEAISLHVQTGGLFPSRRRLPGLSSYRLCGQVHQGGSSRGEPQKKGKARLPTQHRQPMHTGF